MIIDESSSGFTTSSQLNELKFVCFSPKKKTRRMDVVEPAELCLICGRAVDINDVTGEESVCKNPYCSAVLCVPCQQGMARVWDFKCPNCREEYLPDQRWEAKEVFNGATRWVAQHRENEDCPMWLKEVMQEVFAAPSFHILCGIHESEMVNTNFPRGPIPLVPHSVVEFYVRYFEVLGIHMEEIPDGQAMTLVELFLKFRSSPDVVETGFL